MGIFYERLGKAGPGMARLGKANTLPFGKPEGRSLAWLGAARLGWAGRGLAVWDVR